jgi:hypothetical protein
VCIRGFAFTVRDTARTRATEASTLKKRNRRFTRINADDRAHDTGCEERTTMLTLAPIKSVPRLTACIAIKPSHARDVDRADARSAEGVCSAHGLSRALCRA